MEAAPAGLPVVPVSLLESAASDPRVPRELQTTAKASVTRQRKHDQDHTTDKDVAMGSKFVS